MASWSGGSVTTAEWQSGGVARWPDTWQRLVTRIVACFEPCDAFSAYVFVRIQSVARRQIAAILNQIRDPSRFSHIIFFSIPRRKRSSPAFVTNAQFMHRPTAPPPILPLSSCLRFATLPRAQGFVEPITEGETRLKPGFLAASEDGFIYGARGTRAAVCTVTGATLTARWWS